MPGSTHWHTEHSNHKRSLNSVVRTDTGLSPAFISGVIVTANLPVCQTMQLFTVHGVVTSWLLLCYDTILKVVFSHCVNAQKSL